VKILIGSTDDPCSAELSKYADLTLDWADAGFRWKYSIRDGRVSLHLNSGEDYQQLELDSGISICVRMPSDADDFANRFLALLQGVAPEIVPLHPSAIASSLSKPSQLGVLRELAPKTFITNQWDRLLELPGRSMVKGMSHIRTQAMPLRELMDKDSRLNHPLMVQELLEGAEYKVLFIRTFRGLDSYAFKITTEAADYRYTELPKRIEPTYIEKDPWEQFASKISALTGLPYFDLDIKLAADGSWKVLEWNNSPVPEYFEEQIGSHPFLSRCIFAEQAIVCLSTRSDKVMGTLREIESDACVPVHYLYFEDFQREWDFECFQGQLLFRSRQKYYYPLSIYSRPVEDMPASLAALLLTIDALGLAHMGNMASQFNNGSKMLQALRMRPLLGQRSSIRIPKSFYVKSRQSYEKIGEQRESMIVKSGSGIRSIVVDHDKFSQWDESGLDHVPVLFQEKIEGADFRITQTAGAAFGTLIESKNSVDYRYADERAEFKDEPVPHDVQEFCKNILVYEKNYVVGVDFIRWEGSHYFLEANPNPGWTWYFGSQNVHAHTIKENLLRDLIARKSVHVEN
jgi:hypothetical protein